MAATTETTAPTTTADDGSDGLLARLQANRKVLMGAGITVLLVAVVGWFVVESGRRREAAALGILEGAWSLQDQGNMPQASAEFQRVIDGFQGSDAAMQATLALNQVRLETGQAQIAVDALRAFVATGPETEYLAAANRLLGAGLESLAQPAEAATAYLAAATQTATRPLQAEALLGAARAFRNAGNTDEAIRVLRQLVAEHPAAAVTAEARVRLAELTRGAM